MKKTKVTVLGNKGPYPSVNEACSGYLYETRNTKILLDCGSGVFQKLIQKIDLKDLDAVIISHLHGDHMSDLLVLSYALLVKKLPPLKVFIPEKPEAESFALKSNKYLDVEIIRENQVYAISEAKIRFASVKHSILCYATKISSGKSVIVYTGDTQYTKTIGEFAKWCDLLICDAAFSEETYHKGAPHASAIQAGKMAKEAEAAKLLLTHFEPEIDTTIHLVEAKAEFKFCALAKPDLTINI